MDILFIIMHSYKLGSDNNANQNIKDLTPIREGLKKFPLKNRHGGVSSSTPGVRHPEILAL